MIPAREASLDWVRRSLSEELRDDSPATGTRAENLVAIAEHFLIPVETLVRWIHTPALGKQWSSAEFRRYAEVLAENRRQILRLTPGDHWRQLCQICREEVAHRVGNSWRCPRCGEAPIPAPETPQAQS